MPNTKCYDKDGKWLGFPPGTKITINNVTYTIGDNGKVFGPDMQPIPETNYLWPNNRNTKV